MEVKGRHLTAGVPRTITINDAEIREAMAEPIRAIVQAVRDALERVPPELCADIYDRGVVLTGGGALLRNLDKRLRDETGLPVLVAENPLDVGRPRGGQDAVRPRPAAQSLVGVTAGSRLAGSRFAGPPVCGPRSAIRGPWSARPRSETALPGS